MSITVENPYGKGSAAAKGFGLLKSGNPVKVSTFLKVVGKSAKNPSVVLFGLRHSRRLSKIGKIVKDQKNGTLTFVPKGKKAKTVKKTLAPAQPVEA